MLSRVKSENIFKELGELKNMILSKNFNGEMREVATYNY
jgi:hypothetical protein